MKKLDILTMIQDGFGKLSAGLLMIEKRLGQIEGLITNKDLPHMNSGSYHSDFQEDFNPNEKVSKTQAAKILKISVRTLDRYRKKGIIPYCQYNDGGRIYFKYKDIMTVRDKRKGNNRGRDNFSELRASSNK